jgi:hypothetical protein
MSDQNLTWMRENGYKIKEKQNRGGSRGRR